MALYWIIAVSFAGGLMSLLLASIIFKNANAALANNLVSLAVGTLLAASFLEIIPHAMEASNNNFHDISFTVLIGILILFILLNGYILVKYSYTCFVFVSQLSSNTLLIP